MTGDDQASSEMTGKNQTSSQMTGDDQPSWNVVAGPLITTDWDSDIHNNFQ